MRLDSFVAYVPPRDVLKRRRICVYTAEGRACIVCIHILCNTLDGVMLLGAVNDNNVELGKSEVFGYTIGMLALLVTSYQNARLDT